MRKLSTEKKHIRIAKVALNDKQSNYSRNKQISSNFNTGTHFAFKKIHNNYQVEKCKRADDQNLTCPRLKR